MFSLPVADLTHLDIHRHGVDDEQQPSSPTHPGGADGAEHKKSEESHGREMGPSAISIPMVSKGFTREGQPATGVRAALSNFWEPIVNRQSAWPNALVSTGLRVTAGRYLAGTGQKTAEDLFKRRAYEHFRGA
ncbi:hypothetical protein CDD83_10811 [Cordyceps sp. RAO-2017]|nr:hypothetical protein CDD83_10811 [Cordyceps sp. RAO-2017]